MAGKDKEIKDRDWDREMREVDKLLAKLPEADQRAFITAVLRRELGVMATSAFVVAVLAARAQGAL